MGKVTAFFTHIQEKSIFLKNNARFSCVCAFLVVPSNINKLTLKLRLIKPIHTDIPLEPQITLDAGGFVLGEDHNRMPNVKVVLQNLTGEISDTLYTNEYGGYGDYYGVFLWGAQQVMGITLW